MDFDVWHKIETDGPYPAETGTRYLVAQADGYVEMAEWDGERFVHDWPSNNNPIPNVRFWREVPVGPTAPSVDNITTPPGTTGLAVAPWNPEEVYAVAANWAQATDVVRAWDGDEWYDTQYQVATFAHRPNAALAHLLAEWVTRDEVSDAEIAAIVAKATRVDEFPF